MDERLKLLELHFCHLPKVWKERYWTWINDLQGGNLADCRSGDDEEKDISPQLRITLDTVQYLHRLEAELDELRHMASRYRLAQTVVKDFLAISEE